MVPPRRASRRSRPEGRALRWLVVLLAIAVGSGANADARTDYLLYCGGCHLASGAGSPPEVPDLRVDMPKLAQSAEGRAYIVQVPGSFQVPISNARLSAVLNWMLSEYAVRQEFQAFTEAEVTQLRTNALLDPLRLRNDILKPNKARRE